jgi:serine/threonine protein kinase
LKGTKFLHENKLIHRDLKPANIFLHRGTLVIGDLGHAKALDSNNIIVGKYMNI